jgi:nucleotide-binding universal stress UspA family protein
MPSAARGTESRAGRTLLRDRCGGRRRAWEIFRITVEFPPVAPGRSRESCSDIAEWAGNRRRLAGHARHTSCSMLGRRDVMIVVKSILVATDFGPVSDAALTYGRALAKAFGARLHLLHVAENDFLRPSVSDPHARYTATARRLDESLTAEDRSELRAETVLRMSDDPADEITRYARDASIELIVMGTHGRGGIAHLVMGSVAERVVRSAPCPVLTVRHPEHEFVLPDAAAAVTHA